MKDHEKLREAIENARRYQYGNGDATMSPMDVFRILADAAETVSPTRMVMVWRVEWAQRHHVTGDWLPYQDTWPTEEYIRRRAEELAHDPINIACVRVTGPHQQEVPA